MNPLRKSLTNFPFYKDCLSEFVLDCHQKTQVIYKRCHFKGKIDSLVFSPEKVPQFTMWLIKSVNFVDTHEFIWLFTNIQALTFKRSYFNYFQFIFDLCTLKRFTYAYALCMFLIRFALRLCIIHVFDTFWGVFGYLDHELQHEKIAVVISWGSTSRL